MKMATLTVRERIHRARRVGTTFGRVYIGIKTNQLIERRLSPPDMKQRWSRFNQDSANSIYRTAVDLRGLILKGCQFIGSRADVLPPEYVRVLSQLQDRVPAKSFAVVRRRVESELDRPLEDIFASFSEEPIAAASLAQVHEATLKSGERVAVKVQYPEIEALVNSDLRNLKMLFRAVGWIERDFDMMPLVRELATYVPRELDFVNEAHNAEQVAGSFAAQDDIGVPRVYWQYTTKRVLVMEFIDGIKISDVGALRGADVDLNALMQTLVEAYCQQILTHGFFHADPHPGNLLVQPDGAGPGRARIVFVDFGLAKDLPNEFRRGIVDFAAALLTGKPREMAQAMVELGFETRDGHSENLEEIARIVLELAAQMRHQSFIDPALARQAGEELPRLVRANPIVRMPSHIVLIGRVIGLLSGLGSTLGARIDMLRTILPYAMGTGTRSPSPPNA